MKLYYTLILIALITAFGLGITLPTQQPILIPIIVSDSISKDTLITPPDSSSTASDKILECISKEMLLGKFSPERDSNYVVIPTYMCKYKGLYCHREPFAAFIAMRDSARKAGIRLIITSAFRSFDDQKEIWNTKWKSSNYTSTKDEIHKIRSIMRYSSMPGTSRHHWGTEIDVNSCKLAYWNSAEGKRTYRWLCDNAHKFGFYQPYTADPNRTGYAEEKWHWSYKAMSEKYFEAYIKTITAEDITGFRGSHLVDSLNIVQTYVQGVSH